MTDESSSQLAALRQFEIPGALRFEIDEHCLPHARISSALCEATIYLHGAHVTDWHPKDNAPVLFLSEHSEFAPNRPIRGGIPVIFPWFGPKQGDSTAPAHGWARPVQWSVASTLAAGGDIEIVLALDSAAVAPAEPPCKLRLAARCGNKLTVKLIVENLGTEPLRFEEALHSYFAVSDIAGVTVRGLAGTPYFDKVGGAEDNGHADPIAIEAETDRVYAPTTSTVAIEDPALNRRIVIEKSASRATVLWNPWIAKAAALPDFGDDEWKRMLCVETANVAAEAITLPSGAKHKMTCIIRVEPAM